MNLSILIAEYHHKHLIEQMLELYRYDFSEFDECDLDEFGKYGYRYLDHYWTDEDRYPFIVYVDDKLVGFVLINRVAHLEASDQSIAEFCILRKYRGRGNGRAVAGKIFDQFTGTWEVSAHKKNAPAIAFWQKVISDYAKGDYRLHPEGVEHWDGPIWVFENRKSESER